MHGTHTRRNTTRRTHTHTHTRLVCKNAATRRQDRRTCVSSSTTIVRAERTCSRAITPRTNTYPSCQVKKKRRHGVVIFIHETTRRVLIGKGINGPMATSAALTHERRVKKTKIEQETLPYIAQSFANGLEVVLKVPVCCEEQARGM